MWDDSATPPLGTEAGEGAAVGSQPASQSVSHSDGHLRCHHCLGRCHYTGVAGEAAGGGGSAGRQRGGPRLPVGLGRHAPASVGVAAMGGGGAGTPCHCGRVGDGRRQAARVAAVLPASTGGYRPTDGRLCLGRIGCSRGGGGSGDMACRLLVVAMCTSGWAADGGGGPPPPAIVCRQLRLPLCRPRDNGNNGKCQILPHFVSIIRVTAAWPPDGDPRGGLGRRMSSTTGGNYISFSMATFFGGGGRPTAGGCAGRGSCGAWRAANRYLVVAPAHRLM